MKFYYFPAKALGEFSRYIIAISGQNVEDVRVKGTDWPNLKPDTPFGQMPVLQLDNGEMFSQSVSVARYLATEGGLVGKTKLEKFRADMIVDCIRADLWTLVLKMRFEKDPTRKAELKKNIVDKVPFFLAGLEKQVKGTNTFLESGISWADIALYNFIEDALGPLADMTLPTECPKLKKVVEFVKKDPKLQKYMASRPVTTF